MEKDIADRTPPPAKHGGGNATKYVAAALVLVLVGSGGFFGGVQYAESTGAAPGGIATTNGADGTNGGGFGGRMGQRGGFGTVTAVSSSRITISTQQPGADQQSSGSSSDTSTKTYTITSSTTVTNNGSTAAVSDIATGDTVIIRTSSSDATIATAITLNPSMDNFRPNAQTQSGSSTDANSSTST